MTESTFEEARNWFRKNWSTILALTLIFFLALFLRSYFAFEPATETGFVVSGGSDAYYHKRVIDYVIDTGHHLVGEPLLGYPFGSKASGRPPLYDWSVAVSGKGLAPLFGDIDVSVWYSFIFSTAIWGSLTIFPLYFLTKGAFGRRAGLLAAFLLAIMPAHIQRSPLTNGDHDAYVLFFVVTTFFFFMRALGTLKEKKWVSNWLKPKEIGTGLSDFFKSNRKPVLYSSMAAISLTAIALAWKGFGYAVVILLLYFLLQLLINRFRGTDSTGIVTCFAITVGIALLLSFPWYVQFYKMGDFSTPAYMFIGGSVFGLILVVTRDYPWSLVLPAVFTAFGVGIIILALYAPTMVSTFLGGAGYFIRTKAYETIAEAQPPTFSQQAMSFGAVTYFLALVGVAWAAIQLPKRLKPDYLFIIVWTGAAIFMALSAARFIFNGGPAFAAASAWVVVIIVERLDFRSAKKIYESLSGSKLHALRRSIKIRHVAGGFFIAFLVVMPNVWYGVDASIPFEEKTKYDKQIYEATPAFMQPESYSAPWFLGAFGYSLPLKNRYWPAAWIWLSEQDDDILPYENRPAFLSWWDYGFEAVQDGKHPTVADNFLHGYQTAGNFIAAQDENTAIAYLSIQLLQGDYRANGNELSDGIRQILTKHGFDPDEVQTVLRYPTIYIDEILRDPDRFGPRDDEIQAQNALLIYLKQLMIEQLNTDEQADMYRDISIATDKSIRYFAVDSRMFPFSGGNPGIFYAPIKLSDHRIKNYDVRADVPIDFFDLLCVDTSGIEHDCDDVTPAQGVAQFKISYQDMFWNSMFYRAYIGYSDLDLGAGQEGIPGLSGAYSDSPPLHGWNLSHFKLVYRTAYYNPYPPEEYQNHTEAWTAINLDDAVTYQEEIQAGTRTGIIDASPTSGLTNGVIFLKYYHGAIVTGKVSVDQERLLSGVRITVRDEYGVPHYVSHTDSDGRYRVLVPFGEIGIVASTGPINNMTKVGETVLNTTTITVSDDQAMRVPVDMNGDGILDYYITQDISVEGGGVSGLVFVDLNEDGSSDSAEPKLTGSELVFRHNDTGEEFRTTSDGIGFYEISSAFPGDYEVTILSNNRSLGPFGMNVTAGETKLWHFPLKPGSIAGLVKFEDGTPAEDATVVLLDESNSTETIGLSGLNGLYEFGSLLPGNFTITATKGEYRSLPIRLKILEEGDSRFRNATLLPVGDVNGRSRLAGNAVSNVAVIFRCLSYQAFDVFVRTDGGGFYTASLPEGRYLVYALHDLSGQKFVHMGGLTVRKKETITHDIVLQDAYGITGNVVDKLSGITQNQISVTFDRGDARIVVITDPDGDYSVYLPKGYYNIWVSQQSFAHLERRQISQDTTLNLALGEGIAVSNVVFEDHNLNDQLDTGEEIGDVEVALTNSAGSTIKFLTGGDGRFSGTVSENERYRVVLSKRGYSTKQLGSMTVQEIIDLSPVSLTSLSVSLHGYVTMSGEVFTQQTLEIKFDSLTTGGISDEIMTSGGEFQISLRPGRYNMIIDDPVSGSEGERYQLLNPIELDLDPTDRPVEIEIPIARRFLVSGEITLGGTRVFSNITFSGQESLQEDSPNGEYSVYLQEGDYTVIAAMAINETEFMSIKAITISGMMTLDMELFPKVHVTGRVLFEGKEYLEELNIDFSFESGELVGSVNTSEAEYSIELPPGSYFVEIDHPSSESVEGVIKYVRFVFSDTLLVTEGLTEKTFHINLVKVLDNVTLSGRVLYQSQGTSAEATLTAVGGTPSINATFQSKSDGTYSLSIAPGQYSAYIHKKEGHLTYLGLFNIERGEDAHLDFSLGESYRISGTASYGDGLHKRIQILVHGNGTIDLESNDQGYFEVYLPPTQYELTAWTYDYEEGILTVYSTKYDLDVERDEAISLTLEKDIDRDVSLQWNPKEKREISPGESVVYRISIENEGNVPDEFEIAGIPPTEGWTFKFSPRKISLGTGSQASGTIETTITSPLDALVDHGPVKISATSVNDDNTKDEITVEIDIERTWGIGLEVFSDNSTYDGEYLDLYVNLTNLGNGPDSFYIEIVNLEDLENDGWDVGLRNVTSHQTSRGIIGFEVDANSTSTFGVRLVPPKKRTNGTVILYSYSHENRGNDALISLEVASPTADVVDKHIFAEGRGAQEERPEDYVGFLFVGLIAAGLVTAFAYLRRRKKS